MNTTSLETFVAVAKMQSLSKAANMRFLSQSTISTQLSALEAELGYSLFVRQKGRSPLMLTDSGKRFLPIAQKMLRLYEDSISIGEEERHEFTFAGVDTLNSYLLPSFFSLFAFSHPEISLHILTLNSNEVIDAVEGKIADFGLIYMPEKRNGLVVEPYISEPFFGVMHRYNPNPGETLSINPSKLDFSKEICLWMGESYLNWRGQWCKSPDEGYIRVYTLELLVKLLTQDCLWGTVPQSLALELVNNNEYTVLEYTDPPPSRITYKVKNRDSSIKKADTINLFEKNLDRYLMKAGYLFIS